MKALLLIGGALFFVVLFISSPASAFECPKHFKVTQAAIDNAVTAMNSIDIGIEAQKKVLVHTLIDESKMLLSGAKHNHEKPAAGKYDHARSIAKADSALAFAQAAQLFVNR